MAEPVANIYPPDALASRDDLDVIPPAVAPTLDALFRERWCRSPNNIAYTEYDDLAHQWVDYTWSQVADAVSRWQAAFTTERLKKGDRVALRVKNCRDWVIFDQAALGLGLVVVPLYVADRPDNLKYVLKHSDSKVLFVEDHEAWQELKTSGADKLPDLKRVVIRRGTTDRDRLARAMDDWLPPRAGGLRQGIADHEDLASIVYTSGTTGRPKGVMLSHKNMLSNAYSGLRSVAIRPGDVALSFLPLSHTLERTAGYYVPMMAGARVAFTRSIPDLPEDFRHIRPTSVVSVPRIFERTYTNIKAHIETGPAIKRRLFDLTVRVGWARFEHAQRRGPWRVSLLLWPVLDALVARKVRDQVGGRLNIAVVGGAPLPPAVARIFIGLGVTMLQGYGLTEASPSVSINTIEQNMPSSVGLPLRDVEARIGTDNELLVRGPNVMMGYWKDLEATKAVLDGDGWLHTGDQAKIENGFIYIIGRLKDILVLANGEKVPPADMESAITEDPLFEHAMVIGEQMPFLSALVVLNNHLWHELAQQIGVASDDEQVFRSKEVENAVLERVRQKIRNFPGYAKIQRVTATLQPWTVEDGMLTPTLKLKRARALERYTDDIARMYEGHAIYHTQVTVSSLDR